MISFLSEKYLVLLFCLFFGISSLFLFWHNEAAMDPNTDKDWWTLSFQSPDSTNQLDFVVNNHGPKATFQYRITEGRKLLVESVFELENGEARSFAPTVTATAGERTIVTVTRGQETKEIYR